MPETASRGRGRRDVAKLVLTLLRGLLGAALMASVLLICANAFGRYVLHKRSSGLRKC